MHIARRNLLAASAASLILRPSSVFAQEKYPSRPLRWIVPAAPGGGSDATTRLLAEKLSQRLGQPVVVENRAGASGAIGLEVVASAKPDGLTLLQGTVGTHVILPLAARMEGRKLPFDPIKSFEPVSVMAELQLALFCNADLPVNSVQDLVNYAKTKRLAAATDGIGRFTHFALKMFTSKMGIEVTAVPYRGIGATLSDVLENRVQFLFSGLIGPLEHVQTGKMKLLAVCGRTRVPSLPNTPTMIEAGVPDYEATTWYGAFMPVGTDRAIVNRVNAEIVEILKMPDVLKFYRKQGQSAVSSTPEELRERLVRETAKWEDVAQKSGIKLN